MSMPEFAVLKEMCQSYIQDREDINKKLQDNLNKIAEIDVFLKKLREEEGTDLKIFSPRSFENIHGDEINKKEEERNNFEKENQSYYHKINQLDKQIEQLDQFINEERKYCRFKVLDIQEKERHRIARELHDSSVQNLAHLVHMIELSSMFIDQDPVRAKLELESCMRNLRSVIDEIRETIFNLRPMSFDDLGFKQSIDDLITKLKSNYKNCIIEYHVCDLDKCKFKVNDLQTIDLFMVTIYRIINEGITNALKSSEADKIILNVTSEGENCYIAIKDNGKGFYVDEVIEQHNNHFGIAIMQERVNLINGKIDIISEPGSGTELNIKIPLI